MKNFKLKILLTGILITTIIAIIAALTLDCTKYGVYIVIWDVSSILLWLLIGNYIINSHLNTK
jgi:hypothetical protein